MSKGWTCPYCNQIATITTSNVSSGRHSFNNSNREGVDLWLTTHVTVCPNQECRQYTISATLQKTEEDPASYPVKLRPVKGSAEHWQLRPKSKAKALPAYIPAPIVEDYDEACLVLNDSPKASATLSRRCLQGIIRDFWGISKPRLVEEINALKDKIDATTWGQ
jgi:hypothetical protein